MIDHAKPFDPAAVGQPGTVYIDKEGVGVQTGATSGGLYDYTIMENEIASNFTWTGRKMGTVYFGGFTTPPADLLIDSFKIRETNDHIMVNLASVPNLTSIPEPSTILLLALTAGFTMTSRRRGTSVR